MGGVTSCSSDDGGDSNPELKSVTLSSNAVDSKAKQGSEITFTAAVTDSKVSGVTYAWTIIEPADGCVVTSDSKTAAIDSSESSIKLTIADDAKNDSTVTVKVTATKGDKSVESSEVVVTVSSEAEEPQEEEEEDDSVNTTVTFLKGITGGSATAASGEGFFAGTKSGDLDVTVSAVELQLYKSGTGWTAIDAASSSTKAGASNDMMEGPAYISGQLTTKNDAVGNADATVLGTNGYEMGRIKLTVTAGTKAVNVKSLSGYFASGKAFTVGYVKVGENDYEKITYEDSAKLTKSSGSQTGFVAKNFAVGKTIAAGTSADVYILLGKVAESGPTAGVTIEVAELVLTMAESASLESIAATTSKAEYAINEDFDASKVTVKASYSNGKTATVTGWTSNADTVFDKTKAGSYTITISYTEGDVTKTCELPVTVKDKSLASIAVKTNPTKTEYTQGDEALDLTGLVLTLTYDDDSKAEASYSEATKADFATSGFDSSAAAESQAITVTYGGKTTTFNVVIKAKVYFSAFDVTSTGVTANTDNNNGSYTATDGTWSVTGAKIQFTDSNSNSVGVNTYDYDEASGEGYAYTGRVNIKSGNFTISTKADTILRIDGGSGSNGSEREFAISGADKTSWKPSTGSGSFFFKATSETVIITIGSSACNIYGVHVVDTELDPVELSSVTTYTNPTLALSATSVTKDTEVTATVTVPQSVTKTTMSDGTVTETKADVTAEITYKVATVTGETVDDYSDATVTDGKVDTSSAGTFAYTASYTIGTGDNAVTYTSDAVTLEVAGAFVPATENVANNEATLGLTATSVSSSAEGVATVEISGDNIVITSVKKGTATITASDGTNSATIEVTVGAGGAITTEVKKYSAKPELKILTGSYTDAYSFAATSGIYIDKLFSAYGTDEISISITISGKTYLANTGSNNIYCGFTKLTTDLSTTDCAYSGTKGVAKPGGKALNAAGGTSNHTALTSSDVKEDDVVTISMVLSPTSKYWKGSIVCGSKTLEKTGDEKIALDTDATVASVYPFVYSKIAADVTSITVKVGDTTYSY